MITGDIFGDWLIRLSMIGLIIWTAWYVFSSKHMKKALDKYDVEMQKLLKEDIQSDKVQLAEYDREVQAGKRWPDTKEELRRLKTKISSSK